MTISYFTFSHKVIEESRFVHGEEVREFLGFLAAQFPDREEPLRKGTVLWRAQKGNATCKLHDETGALVDEVPVPHGKSRMTPDPAKVGSNRASSKGIAFLYLATNPMTAIHEIRPWVGGVVSVAAFEVLCDLRIVDFTVQSGEPGPDPNLQNVVDDFLSGRERTPQTAADFRKAMLNDIGNAFSRPVSREDDEIEYVPTQIIAEKVRQECYDGLAYKSVFSGGRKEAYNLALFEPDRAKYLTSCMCCVTGVKVSVDGPYGYGWETDCPEGFTAACESPDKSKQGA